MDTTRYRSSGSLTGSGNGYRTRYFPISCANRTASAWTAYNAIPAKFGYYKSVWDVVTPGYQKRRKNGEWIPPNPFSVAEAKVTSSGTTFLRDTTVAPSCSGPTLNNWSEYDGVLMPFHFDSILGGYTPQTVLADGRTGDLTTQVITECMANRRKGEANFIESLAELDQLYRMLGNPLENVRKFLDVFRRSSSYRELKRLRKKYPGFRFAPVNASKIAKREIRLMLLLASSEFLRFRFGISPLIADVKAAMDALQKGWDRPATYHAARSKGELTGSVLKTFAVPETYWTWNFVRSNIETLSIRAAWWDSYRRNPYDELGLTFHNVVAVPWELTRFSFIVDRFVNIGDLIYANVPRVNLVPMGGTYTVLQNIYNSGYFTGYTNVNSSVIVRTGSYNDRVDIHVKKLSRTHITEKQQRGGLVWKFDPEFGTSTPAWQHAADLIAISIQLFKSLSF